MKQLRIILKIAAIVIVCLISNQVQSQQSKVDSIITLLNKSNTEKGLDTLTFNNARQLIRTADLTDAQIILLEKTAEQFKKGKDEDLFYAVKFVLLVSLSTTDPFKAIDYAKRNIEQLERSSTLRSTYITSAFLTQLRLPYRNSSKLPEGFQYYTDKLNQYKKDKNTLALATCYYVLAVFYSTNGLYEPAIYNTKKSISLLDTSDFKSERYLDFTVNHGKAGWINNSYLLTSFYFQIGEYEKAITHGKQILRTAIDYYKAGGKGVSGAGISLLAGARRLAISKILINQLDSVDYYLKLAESAGVNADDKSMQAEMMQFRSLYDIKRGAYKEADTLLEQCRKLVKLYQIPASAPSGIIEPDYYLALLRTEQKRYLEAIDLLLRNIARIKLVRLNVLRDYKLLASLYEKTGEQLKAKEIYKAFISLQDSVAVDQSKYRTISFETEQQITDNEIAISKLETANKLAALSRNFTIGIAALILIFAGGIYFRFRAKKKANELLEKTLAELKSTQAQLIQSEKMASLGELTAGIAHEIQNPLNFVNNFSEVSNELIAEIKVERSKDKGERDEQLESEILNDIEMNLEKINHHGKRASAIVKGMLEHSRISTGQKEPTDINALCDEYLRLAYQSLKAKNKDFNATMETHFDANLPKIEIIPQDIGRVLLNLINNAFYAVNERSKKVESDYVPTVSVTTELTANSQLLIAIKDNGSGIPDAIKDKIFQPFFTTKPTGQGTGLGLSLAYDIVKAHGGEIKVTTKENKYTEFIIQIPIQ